jgi:MFS family permease
LAVLLSAWFLAQFDFFVVNVAADAFRRGLGAGPAELELIVGGYAFSYAAGMITGGRLGDRFGHRRVFVAGVLAFTAASLLCGAAQGPLALVAARLLQGLAGALMVPQVLALITDVFPPHARGRALGWHGAVGGLGSIAGQVLGGLLLDADVLGLGWRVIFLVNVPVGIVAAVLAARLLPGPGAARGRTGGQDPLGALGLAAGLGLLLVPLALGRDQGWPAWTWASMAAGAALLGLVGGWQRHLAGHGGAPVLDVTLFRSRSYLAGIGAVTAFMAYFASFMFTLSLLLQGGLGLGALQAGLVFAPMGVLFGATALLGPRLVDRYGPLVTVYGCGAVALGLLLLVLRVGAAGGPAGTGWIVVALALIGLGNGLVLPRLIGISLTDVRPGRAGVAAAVLTTAQQFAGAAGVAVLGTVFFAAAGPSVDAVRGMRRAALLDIALIAVVALLVARLTGAVRRRRVVGDRVT